tara:strand:- start:668 stop:1903 length:1236 start_codon:yes stop_codon:yes gene_type:complete
MTSHQKTYNLNHININLYLEGLDNSQDQQNNQDLSGSKIISKNYTYNNNLYKILKYDKSKLDKSEYGSFGMCRSIVVRNNRIVSFAPPKSICYEDFTNKYSAQECFAEDFIDGTMINLFYDETINTWEIATRSTVGGNTQFFMDNENNKKTFREMFFEACSRNNINIDLLDNNFCYSFVLQHPNNRIVTPVDFPKLFLVRAYNINNETYTVTEVAYEVLTSNSGGFWNTGILFPYRYNIDTFENLVNHYNNSETPFYCVGVVINSNDCRTKVRNQNYENIRELRGNQSRLQYHYLMLRQKGKVKDFLLFYQEFSNNFKEYRQTIHEYTNNLYSNYIKCYIKKQQELKLFPYEFKVHMYNMHQKYLTELKPQGGYIDKNFVINYFNTLHPSQQMHILNCRKKYNLEEINREN